MNATFERNSTYNFTLNSTTPSNFVVWLIQPYALLALFISAYFLVGVLDFMHRKFCND